MLRTACTPVIVGISSTRKKAKNINAPAVKQINIEGSLKSTSNFTSKENDKYYNNKNKNQENAQPEFVVLVNAKDDVYLRGMTVDYVRQGLNEGFEFKNPNERDRCGCGESFRV